jgi:putative intracellular protease/amidase
MGQFYFVRLLLACFLFLTAMQGRASAPAADLDGIRAAVQLYLNGTSFNIRSDIDKAFYPTARLYLDGKDGAVREMSAVDYAQLFPEDKKAQFNGRLGRLLSIDVTGSVATAKAEILMPKPGIRFVDVFLLKKIGGAWKIVSKSAHRSDGPQHGRKILFVVSNAHQYPGTSVNTGNNFPELAYAYDSFVKAGYAVDVTSPEGGAVPLEMISTSDALQKSYLYNSDFMWALAHTKPVAALKAADYAGLVYIGGGAAIVGVPDNAAIQAIAMRIHEQQGGMIAAICQGTEGLTRLRKPDGSYLVSGKVLTSFPDAFLNQASPIFKAYPFSVEGSIRQRGGKFVHGANGKSHVEVDGRLVTGMNWESSVGVAEAMIRQLDQGK